MHVRTKDVIVLLSLLYNKIFADISLLMISGFQFLKKSIGCIKFNKQDEIWTKLKRIYEWDRW